MQLRMTYFATLRREVKCLLRIAVSCGLVINMGCERTSLNDYEVVQQACSDCPTSFWGSSVPDFSSGREYWYSELYFASRGDICQRFLMATEVPLGQIQAAVDNFKTQPGCRDVENVQAMIDLYSGSNTSGQPIWFDLTDSLDYKAFAYSLPPYTKSVGGTTRITLLAVSTTDQKCWYWSSYER